MGMMLGTNEQAFGISSLCKPILALVNFNEIVAANCAHETTAKHLLCPLYSSL